MKILKIILLSFLFSPSIIASDWNIKSTSGVNGGTQNRLYFQNESIGWITGLGNSFFKTINSGNSWTKKSVTGADAFYCVVFLDDLNGFLSADVGELYKTIDGGDTWSLVTTANFPKVTIVDLHCVTLTNNTKRIFAIGGSGRPNENTFENRNTILYSDDNGITWTTLENKIGVSSYSKSQVIGDKIAINNLFGVRFLDVNTLKFNNYSIGNLERIKDLYFLNEKNGWAVGEEMKIFRTEDGGINWEEINDIGGTGYLQSIFFINPFDGFVGDENGNIYELTWAGEKIITSEKLSTQPIQDIHFHNQSDGLILADGPNLYTNMVNSQINSNALEINNTITTYGEFKGVTDIEITNMINPPSGKCNIEFAPLLSITNVGEEAIDSIIFKTYSGKSLLNQMTHKYTLETNESVEVTLPIVSLSNTDSLSFSIEVLLDNNSSNDTLFISQNAISEFPYIADFEDGKNWSINNPDNNKGWEIGIFNSKNGEKSTMYNINNYNYNLTGDIDQIISPELDLSKLKGGSITFDYAYAPDRNNFNEGIKISFSSDCGTTFTKITELIGLDLATKPAQSNWFIPTTNDWKTYTIDISQHLPNGVGSIYIDNIASYSNAIYIDNFRIDGTDIITSNDNLDTNNLTLYPNPFSDYIYIQKPIEELKIYSIEGQLIKTLNSFYDNKIDLSDFEKGTYIAILKRNQKTTTIKILKQ